ncbi:Uncharacterised protein [Enterobacter cancerogenus]|uniref:Uncharacterized protein n=1 Tax=Enterobacter cancerogenus TaxID=69218 RepID=A0A484Z0F4_9ENTR|nr:Uncharacterised protein [Enterobacter cancerogenus]
MKRYGQVFLLAIGFDLYWTLVVLFREQGAGHLVCAGGAGLADAAAIIPGVCPWCWPSRAGCLIPSGR